MFGALRPIQVIGQGWLSKPVVGVGGLDESIGPAFGEEPPCFTACDADAVFELVAVHLGDFFDGLSALHSLHDLGFRSVDLDVAGFGAVGWVVGVRGADVGDFQDHVRLPLVRFLAVPEADADILHAVA